MRQKKKSKSGGVGLSRTLGLLLAGSPAFCLLSCQPNHSINARNQSAVNGGSRQFYFVTEETKQRELLQKVAELKLGDSRKDVIMRLGPPSYDRPDVTKDGKTLGRSVVYYLKIWQKDSVNEKHDRLIRLEFDRGDRLTKIVQKVEDTP